MHTLADILGECDTLTNCFRAVLQYYQATQCKQQTLTEREGNSKVHSEVCVTQTELQTVLCGP